MKDYNDMKITDFFRCFGISTIEIPYRFSEREINWIKIITQNGENVTIDDGVITEVNAFGIHRQKSPNTEIEKVIFNPPATIVYWADGTKTVVKCCEMEDFDEEKGLAMAVCKKIFGEHYYTGVIKKYAKSKTAEPEVKIGSCCDGHVRYSTPGTALEDFNKAVDLFMKNLNDATKRKD